MEATKDKKKTKSSGRSNTLPPLDRSALDFSTLQGLDHELREEKRREEERQRENDEREQRQAQEKERRRAEQKAAEEERRRAERREAEEQRRREEQRYEDEQRRREEQREAEEEQRRQQEQRERDRQRQDEDERRAMQRQLEREYDRLQQDRNQDYESDGYQSRRGSPERERRHDDYEEEDRRRREEQEREERLFQERIQREHQQRIEAEKDEEERERLRERLRVEEEEMLKNFKDATKMWNEKGNLIEHVQHRKQVEKYAWQRMVSNSVYPRNPFYFHESSMLGDHITKNYKMPPHGALKPGKKPFLQELAGDIEKEETQTKFREKARRLNEKLEKNERFPESSMLAGDVEREETLAKFREQARRLNEKLEMEERAEIAEKTEKLTSSLMNNIRKRKGEQAVESLLPSDLEEVKKSVGELVEQEAASKNEDLFGRIGQYMHKKRAIKKIEKTFSARAIQRSAGGARKTEEEAAKPPSSNVTKTTDSTPSRPMTRAAARRENEKIVPREVARERSPAPSRRRILPAVEVSEDEEEEIERPRSRRAAPRTRNTKSKEAVESEEMEMEVDSAAEKMNDMFVDEGKHNTRSRQREKEQAEMESTTKKMGKLNLKEMIKKAKKSTVKCRATTKTRSVKEATKAKSARTKAKSEAAKAKSEATKAKSTGTKPPKLPKMTEELRAAIENGTPLPRLKLYNREDDCAFVSVIQAFYSMDPLVRTMLTEHPDNPISKIFAKAGSEKAVRLGALRTYVCLNQGKRFDIKQKGLVALYAAFRALCEVLPKEARSMMSHIESAETECRKNVKGRYKFKECHRGKYTTQEKFCIDLIAGPSIKRDRERQKYRDERRRLVKELQKGNITELPKEYEKRNISNKRLEELGLPRLKTLPIQEAQYEVSNYDNCEGCNNPFEYISDVDIQFTSGNRFVIAYIWESSVRRVTGINKTGTTRLLGQDLKLVSGIKVENEPFEEAASSESEDENMTEDQLKIRDEQWEIRQQEKKARRQQEKKARQKTKKKDVHFVTYVFNRQGTATIHDDDVMKVKQPVDMDDEACFFRFLIFERFTSKELANRKEKERRAKEKMLSAAERKELERNRKEKQNKWLAIKNKMEARKNATGKERGQKEQGPYEDYIILRKNIMNAQMHPQVEETLKKKKEENEEFKRIHGIKTEPPSDDYEQHQAPVDTQPQGEQEDVDLRALDRSFEQMQVDEEGEMMEVGEEEDIASQDNAQPPVADQQQVPAAHQPPQGRPRERLFHPFSEEFVMDLKDKWRHSKARGQLWPHAKPTEPMDFYKEHLFDRARSSKISGREFEQSCRDLKKGLKAIEQLIENGDSRLRVPLENWIQNIISLPTQAEVDAANAAADAAAAEAAAIRQPLRKQPPRDPSPKREAAVPTPRPSSRNGRRPRQQSGRNAPVAPSEPQRDQDEVMDTEDSHHEPSAVLSQQRHGVDQPSVHQRPSRGQVAGQQPVQQAPSRDSSPEIIYDGSNSGRQSNAAPVRVPQGQVAGQPPAQQPPSRDSSPEVQCLD